MNLPPDLAELFRNTPVNRTLRFELHSHSEERCELSMPSSGDFAQEEGFIQGGILIAIADTAAVYLVHPGLDPAKTMTSIESKMNYFRPALPDQGRIWARSSVLKRGRRIAVCEVDIHQDERYLAKGTFTYLIYDKPG